MPEQGVTINEFGLNFAELSPEMLEQAVVGDSEGVTLSYPHSYTVELPELPAIGKVTIGRFQLRLAAGLVRQLAASLPDEAIH